MVLSRTVSAFVRLRKQKLQYVDSSDSMDPDASTISKNKSRHLHGRERLRDFERDDRAPDVQRHIVNGLQPLLVVEQLGDVEIGRGVDVAQHTLRRDAGSLLAVCGLERHLKVRFG